MVSGSRLACIAVFEGGTQWGQFSLWPSGSQLVGHDPKNNAQCSQQNKGLKGNKKNKRERIGICYKPDSNNTINILSHFFTSLTPFLRVFFHEAHAKAVSCPVEQSCMPLWSLKVTLLTLSELICIIHISSPFIFIVLWDASYSVIICYSIFIPDNWGVTQKKGGVWVKLDAHLISGSLRALYKKEREKTHTYIL